MARAGAPKKPSTAERGSEDRVRASSPVIDPVIDIESPKRFVNRELSWLAFNARVLEEADNVNHPLLERLRFLSISSNNLDEFYMVRVAGLRGQIQAKINKPSQDGLTPSAQLKLVNEYAALLLADQQRCWKILRKELRKQEIDVLNIDRVSGDEREWLETYFLEHIFPILTPLAVDPAHPFPFIPNLGLVLALQLRRCSDNVQLNALIPLPRQIQIQDGSPRIV